jgi:hypothetical protein
VWGLPGENPQLDYNKQLMKQLVMSRKTMIMNRKIMMIK